MRWITLGLIALLTLVQAELWFGKGGVTRMVELQRKLDAQKSTNEQAKRRNDRVIGPRIREIDAKPDRARDATQTILAAGEGRPAKGDCVGERRERER